MSGKAGAGRGRRRSTLARRPDVGELRDAGRRDKIVAGVGLVLTFTLALIVLLWGRRSGALSAGIGGGSPMEIYTLNLAGGLACLAAGVVILLFGWPLYRLTVILIGLSIGATVAGGLGWVAAGNTGAFVGGFLGGLVGGLAAWPTEVLIRTVTGAIAGMSLGLAAGGYLGGVGAVTGCALGGLLLGGALTFLFYRAVLIVNSAIVGALMTGYGALCAWQPSCVLRPRAWMLGAVAALAVLGAFVQRSLGEDAREEES